MVFNIFWFDIGSDTQRNIVRFPFLFFDNTRNESNLMELNWAVTELILNISAKF